MFGPRARSAGGRTEQNDSRGCWRHGPLVPTHWISASDDIGTCALDVVGCLPGGAMKPIPPVATLFLVRPQPPLAPAVVGLGAINLPVRGTGLAAAPKADGKDQKHLSRAPGSRFSPALNRRKRGRSCRWAVQYHRASRQGRPLNTTQSLAHRSQGQVCWRWWGAWYMGHRRRDQ